MGIHLTRKSEMKWDKFSRNTGDRGKSVYLQKKKKKRENRATDKELMNDYIMNQ